MYLINRMRQIYETASPSSTEAIISRYILMNMKNLDKLSVANIANQTSISKSSVSKFIKSISFDNGFAQFISSLKFELQYIMLDRQTMISDALIIQSNPIFYFKQHPYYLNDFMSIQEILPLAQHLDHKKRIIFCGDDSKKGAFHHLINCLLFDGKDVKFSSWAYSEQQIQEITSLNENDMLIIVDTGSSLYDFYQRSNLSVDLYSDFQSVITTKYFIGRPSKGKNGFHVIGIETTRNIFSDELLLTHFNTQVLAAYLQFQNDSEK